MSTSYDFIEPVNLNDLLPELKKYDITLEHREDSDVLTDGKNYMYIDQFEWDGEKYLSLTRYGMNYTYDILEAISDITGIDYLSEHDEGYFDLPWFADNEE